ncbi:MAG: UDP-N-acetylmuramoyl-tripeptide--D-alanyl-D-alanine ligase [Deltaproteobacteria bacterium]|nr:UDP-N-acetylmuramoyl-tripeptide--D-alanyl-D-alanine ligase [Deltaproteobacteria bacterium]
MVEQSTGKGPRLTCSAVLEATGGRLVQGDREASFAGLSTDSRTLKGGEVFLALKGERFDGHAFVEEALSRGASGVIVEEGDLPSGVFGRVGASPVIGVSDTLRALGDIARFWRDRFTLPVVCLTGSNGKTSTKEMIASVLEESFTVLKNPGNFNNLVGVPLTLLELQPRHQVAVVEIGTNVPGEIRRLAEIARPTTGLITNIGQAHLEGMGSLEALIREKGDLFRSIPEEGVVIVNRNDPHVSSLAGECRARKIGFAVEGRADVVVDRLQWRGTRGVRFRLTVGGKRVSVDFPLLGEQFVHNAAAAAAVAFLLGIEPEAIGRRLERFSPLPMRMEPLCLEGVNFINDTYNANPPSVEMALRALCHVSGGARAFVVLGDMLELGEISREAHRAVGRVLGGLDLAGVFLLGEYAPEVAEGAIEAGTDRRRVCILESHAEIARLLKGETRPGDWVLVKGSRGMRMERVIEILGEEA